MARIIEKGSAEHKAHLAGVEADKKAALAQAEEVKKKALPERKVEDKTDK